MIDGRFVMRDGVLFSVHEQDVRERAQAAAEALVARAGTERFRHHPWRSATTAVASGSAARRGL